MSELSSLETEILRAAFHDGALRSQDGGIVAIRTNVAIRGTDAVRALRSLRARGYLEWTGTSVSGGELYRITAQGREAWSALSGPSSRS